ncbi:hypothetical protein ONM90_20750, partial [Salmonella enterica subsp. enterica serovar Cerro]|nr:hypothetical protein [Salmonella enterica subsp. enterica serovar Cerro]
HNSSPLNFLKILLVFDHQIFIELTSRRHGCALLATPKNPLGRAGRGVLLIIRITGGYAASSAT